jgi:hypothetical protein
MRFKAGLSEPALFSLDVGSDKLLVLLSEIDYSLDDSNHVWHDCQKATAQNTHQKHYYTFSGVAQNELMDSQAAQQNSANAGGHLLVRAQRLPVSHRLLIN